MAIKRMKWSNFLKSFGEASSGNYYLESMLNDDNDTVTVQLAKKIDELYKDKILAIFSGFNSSQYIGCEKSLDELIRFMTAESDNNIWNDMPIWVSSYKVGTSTNGLTNRLPANSIYSKLVQYMTWVIKVMEDDGVAKSVVITRGATDNSSSSGTTKDSYSETPQLSQTDFDEDMLDYRSNFDKATADSTFTRQQSANITTKHKSWDEELKNLRMTYYNDIIEYMMRFPSLIYQEYALDSMPYPDLIKLYIKNIKDTFDNLDNE